MTVTVARLRELFRLEEPVLELVDSRVEDRGSHVVERLAFRSSTGEAIRGILTRPAGPGPHPAILYPHSHGGEYEIGADELLEGRRYLLSPLGPVFAEAGYVTLMLDMPTFGERSDQKELPVAKALIWHGKSLIGKMLGENAAALTWLAARPDVDVGRIGMFGISMGCVISYWLTAVDPRVAAVAHLCCYADFDALIEADAHNRHGLYLTVPGLLEETSPGEIAGLIAPRPQLICLGEADALTPPDAIARALAITRPMYEGAELEIVSEPGIGHSETARMREAVLAFFRRHLG